MPEKILSCPRRYYILAHSKKGAAVVTAAASAEKNTFGQTTFFSLLSFSFPIEKRRTISANKKGEPSCSMGKTKAASSIGEERGEKSKDLHKKVEVIAAAEAAV